MIRNTILAALAVLAVAVPARAADDLPLSAFFGTWEGNGIAENADSLFFAVTTRDMDVVIQPSGDGFTVTWTTVIRSGGDPNNPDVRRREASLTLVPAERTNLFRAPDSGNPIEGGVMSWARLHGNTLSVYQMILEDDGGYALTSYDRTLSDAGMELVFQRLRDGEPVRTVSARLVKVAG